MAAAPARIVEGIVSAELHQFEENVMAFPLSRCGCLYELRMAVCTRYRRVPPANRANLIRWSIPPVVGGLRVSRRNCHRAEFSARSQT